MVHGDQLLITLIRSFAAARGISVSYASRLLTGSGDTVDRVRFLDGVLHGESISIDGFRLRFGQGDNQGSDRVFLTVIGRGGRYSSVPGFDSAMGR